MAKYEFKIEITPEDGANEITVPGDEPWAPTLAQVAASVLVGVRVAFPNAEVRVYDGNRPDVD